jgi:hypothetical protein
MSILEVLRFKFRPELGDRLVCAHAKQYSLEVDGYVANSLRWLAGTYPDIGLDGFTSTNGSLPPPKIYINHFLLHEAIDAAYLDLYFPNEFHVADNGSYSDARHAAVVVAWLNRYKPLQVIAGIDETWVVFINALLSLHVGISILLQIRRLGGEAGELIIENDRVNDLIYLLHWRCPDYKQLTSLLQWIK